VVFLGMLVPVIGLFSSRIKREGRPLHLSAVDMGSSSCWLGHRRIGTATILSPRSWCRPGELLGICSVATWGAGGPLARQQVALGAVVSGHARQWGAQSWHGHCPGKGGSFRASGISLRESSGVGRGDATSHASLGTFRFKQGEPGRRPNAFCAGHRAAPRIWMNRIVSHDHDLERGPDRKPVTALRKSFE